MFFALLAFRFSAAIQFSDYDPLTPAEHDTVQAARYLAQTGRFGTNVIRPLLTDRVAPNADGTLPDLAHPPLYPVLVSGTMRAFHQTYAGQGRREAALVSVVFFALSVGACGWLARQMFGAGVGLLATAFYALATPSGLHFAFAPSPIALGTLLLTLLFLTLHKLDSIPLAGENPLRSPLWMAGIAGGVCGLLYLTIYSTFALLPLFLAYLWRIGGREKGSVILAFLSVWLLVCGPLLVRNARLTRNPVHNSRLFELMMHMDAANPQTVAEQNAARITENTNLYHEADLPQTFVRFAARGGVVRLLVKVTTNIAGLVRESPVWLGVFVVPLFLGAGLSRFPDARTNRLRNLGYAALGVHCVGISFFLPADEATALFRLYAPLASCLGAAFLLAVVRARNLPAFYARAAVWVWAGIGCFGGLATLGAGEDFGPKATLPPTVFYALNNQSPEMNVLRTRRNAFLLSSDPERGADILGFPVALLPSDSRSVAAVQTRMGKWAGGVVLTPNLDRPDDEIAPSALIPWAQLYRQIVQLRNITSVLDAKTRRSVVQQKEIFYPTALSAAMRSFPRPVPYAERLRKQETSLIFWNAQAFDARISAGGPQEP